MIVGSGCLLFGLFDHGCVVVALFALHEVYLTAGLPSAELIMCYYTHFVKTCVCFFVFAYGKPSKLQRRQTSHWRTYTVPLIPILGGGPGGPGDTVRADMSFPYASRCL